MVDCPLDFALCSLRFYLCSSGLSWELYREKRKGREERTEETATHKQSTNQTNKQTNNNMTLSPPSIWRVKGIPQSFSFFSTVDCGSSIPLDWMVVTSWFSSAVEGRYGCGSFGSFEEPRSLWRPEKSGGRATDSVLDRTGYGQCRVWIVWICIYLYLYYYFWWV